MPPKKPAADSADPSSSDAPVEEKLEKKTDAATVRKIAAHPSTAIMVKEALKELDSRKGVSSQAIQSFIKQKYPSVDLVRLKHFVRRALKKGIENGTLVRPANSGVATGAMGKFRLAPKIKESKPKNENVDPNAQKAPKPVKEGAKKPKKAGMNKMRTIRSVCLSEDSVLIMYILKRCHKEEGLYKGTDKFTGGETMFVFQQCSLKVSHFGPYSRNVLFNMHNEQVFKTDHLIHFDLKCSGYIFV
uniref:H15 domain-containing protein n=1 Tax=Anabas testudineus TaxID=64144 RepID=A0AAQ6I8B2_ANATE